MREAARDLPFIDGRPFAPGLLQWIAALGLVCAGVIALLYGQDLTGVAWPGVVLFVGLPLAGLALLCRGRLDLVFAPPGWKDIGIGVGFGLLNLIVTIGIGGLFSQLFQTAPNPIGQSLARLSDSDIPAFLGTTAVQLIGEELVTVIPFLAVLVLCRHLGGDRRLSIGLAAVAAAVFFAALHFPTYQWHIPQTLLIIGVARLVLLGAYLMTRTLWASAVAHIVNDWALFGAMILLVRAHG